MRRMYSIYKERLPSADLHSGCQSGRCVAFPKLQPTDVYLPAMLNLQLYVRRLIRLASIFTLTILLTLPLAHAQDPPVPTSVAPDTVPTGVATPSAVPTTLANPPPPPNTLMTTLPCTATSPRMRVEFRQLTDQQRRDYLAAVTCLRTLPSRLGAQGSRSVYDDFVYVHMQSVPMAHNVAAFLPWHRPLVSLYEAALQTLCNYTHAIPYWDWSVDAGRVSTALVWSVEYFGGSGDPDNGYCVTTGHFANENAAYPDMHCLQRRFAAGEEASQVDGDMEASQYSPVELQWILQQPTYDTFRRELENHPHNNIHGAIGGDMPGLITSVNDPIFWLHHANLDRWWYLWQQRNPELANTFSGNRQRDAQDANDATPDDVMIYSGIWPDLRVRDVFNTVGGANGLLCYNYSASLPTPNITNPLLLRVSQDSLPDAQPQAAAVRLPHVPDSVVAAVAATAAAAAATPTNGVNATTTARRGLRRRWRGRMTVGGE
ncbi:uncharacterized protein EV422DRAFT_578414 [Fimicolochytrium jonesii]|uniref:uncharacterized protein n=1 Tax=Fimicolochytrium jonesii TaxID=1396493 RepID=UPI0022FEAFC5|nr:uncharacterized protein EV422DRAFT_578414 [Fimicolochytrium jonesii]KAI8821062.1 hypothetical protein EV422DRAFT_578414 [Fimicolochytrium jonesii]